MPSVLDRYLNIEKYQNVMRDLVNAQILNDKSQSGLFLKDTALSRIGWTGTVKQFPDAKQYTHVYNNGDKNDGIFFKTPRMIVIHCGFRKDRTFIEDSKASAIVGRYPEDKAIYDKWEEENPGQNSPYRRRRLILFFLVDANGAPTHKKPLILSIHGGASNLFCDAYQNFIEQLESVFADVMGLKTAAGFDPKQTAAAIFTPTFGSQLYGGGREKSWISYPESWVVPTADTIGDFFPKKEEDIDLFEEVWATCPVTIYAASYFAQCAQELGLHALKPGVDLSLPPIESNGGSTRTLLGARDADTGEISF